MRMRPRALAARARVAAAAWLASLGGACLEVPHAKGPGEVDVHDVKADGLELETACTPSGFEVCFDAYDNNCNGVIDEGCGLQTGLLQFAIAWAEAADVDLSVISPDGNRAQPDEPNDAGLMKDRDCKGESGDACHGQNVENVFLAEGWPRRGRYQVVIKLQDPRDVSAPVKVRMSARVGQRHFSSVVTLVKRGDERELDFTL